MPIKTQMRLNQITASFGSALGEINDSLTNKAALDSIYTQNLSGSLSYMASAIRRIHGGTDFSNQTAGSFSQDLLLDTTKKLQFRDATEYINSDADGSLNIQAAGDVALNINGTDELLVNATTATFGTNIVIPNDGQIGSVGDADALAISTAGQVTVSATANATNATNGALKLLGGLSIASGKDVFIGGDATVDGGDITLGADADGSDRTIVFGHSTLKSVMGIDDSGDVFAINTDASFEAENDFQIEVGGNVLLGNGKLTVSGDTTAGDNASIGYTSTEGIVITGQGSVMDITIKNDADAVVLEVPTGTTNVVIPGNLIVDGTTTTVNTAQLMVEDKLVVLGIPDGMTLPGVATYTVSSNVVTVTSTGHGLVNGEFVLIQDPAATEVITEGVYLITAADANTFAFAFTTGDVGATPINHSVANVTSATASGSGIMAAPGSVVETSLKWDSTHGWIIGGPLAATAGLSPAVADSGALGNADKEWSDLYLADASVIYMGADQDVTLTHVADTGILLNSNMQLQFRDATEYINSDADGYINVRGATGVDLNIAGTDVLNITAASAAVVGALSNTTAATLASASGVTTIGSSNQVTVSAGGILNVANTTAASAIGTAALVVDGGASVAADLLVGDDLTLLNDNAVLGFGANTDTTLAHTDGTGLTLNSTNKLCFQDAGTFINSSEDGQLDLSADGAMADAVLLSAAAGGVTIDAGLDITLDADGDDIILKASSANAFAQFNRASATVGYLNFNGDGSVLTAGSGGWGFRNNAGTMQFKDSGGAWQGFAASGGGSRKKDSVTITAQATAVTSQIGGFLTATTGSLDVFLNGQLMLSGAGGTGADYNVTAAQTVTFQFNVEPDDVVTFVLP